jgi:hypothetical protein
MGVDWQARKSQLAEERAKVASKPISFILDGEPVSGNVSLNSHWAVRHRRNKHLRNAVFAAAYNAGWRKDWELYTHIKVTIIGWRGDVDNAISGTKPIVDALTYNDIIRDDNPKYCRVEYEVIRAKGQKKRVRVEADNG